MYVEIVSNLRIRGEIVPLDTVDQIAKKATGELYRSLFSFGEELKEYINKNGSISGFDGIANIDQVVLDVDGETEEAYAKLLKVISILEQEEVSDKSMQIYFSGRGFHIYLHPSLFNIAPSQTAHKELKKVVSQYFGGLTDLIYDKTRLIRVPNSLNSKTNLYKIPLSKEEVLELTPTDIMDEAKEQRWDYEVNLISGSHIFTYTEEEELERKRGDNDKIKKHRKYNCIHNILDAPPPVGQRHNYVLRIASHFHRQGYSSDVTKDICMGWINDTKEVPDIIKTVEDVYQWDSFYSCKDELLKKHCEKSCMFYEGADDVFDIKDMYQEYQKQLQRKNEVIHLGNILHTVNKFDILGGELVILLGATGSGKTTLAQNIVTNITLPTLFFSLEMPPHQMYRRFVQILYGVDKQSLTRDMFRKANQRLKHIILTPKSVYPNEISKFVELYQPKVLVIDHLLLMRSQHRDEYARVGELTAELKQLALAENIIVIGISQVNRESAKEGLTTFSGKGSGSIENDSDKVLGFSKPSRLSKEAKVQCLKDREGQSLDILVNINNFQIT